MQLPVITLHTFFVGSGHPLVTQVTFFGGLFLGGLFLGGVFTCFVGLFLAGVLTFFGGERVDEPDFDEPDFEEPDFDEPDFDEPDFFLAGVFTFFDGLFLAGVFTFFGGELVDDLLDDDNTAATLAF
jgi:hypothetical protein